MIHLIIASTNSFDCRAGFCGFLEILWDCVGLNELCRSAPVHPVRRPAAVYLFNFVLVSLLWPCTAQVLGWGLSLNRDKVT